MPRLHADNKQPKQHDAIKLASRFGVTPDKRHSQNFMQDASVIDHMVSLAKLSKGDNVVEVGAGFGALTLALNATGAKVTTFEIDPTLCTALQEILPEEVTLHREDFFRWYKENAHTLKQPFSIIANLPYNASSFFFQTVLSGPVQPERILVLLQKEVAERIAAKPGSMSVLAISVQSYGDAAVQFVVPRSAFWPVPDVDSAVLDVAHIHAGNAMLPKVLRLAKIAFAGKRKQLHNTLASGLHITVPDTQKVLQELHVPLTARPQELSLEQWNALAKKFLP